MSPSPAVLLSAETPKPLVVRLRDGDVNTRWNLKVTKARVVASGVGWWSLALGNFIIAVACKAGKQ